MVLAVDPGTLHCGYALLEGVHSPNYKKADVISVSSKKSYSQRIFEVANKLEEVISQNQVTELALEEAFTQKNVQSAFRLAELRGALFYLAGKYSLKVYEYSPKKIKKSITGNGNASKEQVAMLAQAELGLQLTGLRHDATDALAIALHHFHSSKVEEKLKNMNV